jgi:hypothetical protein
LSPNASISRGLLAVGWMQLLGVASSPPLPEPKLACVR